MDLDQEFSRSTGSTQFPGSATIGAVALSPGFGATLGAK